MIKILVLFTLILYSSVGTTQIKRPDDSILINSIVSNFKKMRYFDREYEKDQTNRNSDSIYRYNDSLKSLIFKLNCFLLTKNEIARLEKQTEITVSGSKDNKIYIFSWLVDISSASQDCSNMVWAKSGNAKYTFIDLDDIGGSDNRVRMDTVVELQKKGKTHYMFIGSIRCGKLCIYKKATIYTLTKKGIIQDRKCFFDGKEYSSSVDFNCILNAQISGEPSFIINHYEISLPLFNGYNTMITGIKKYKIVIH